MGGSAPGGDVHRDKREIPGMFGFDNRYLLIPLFIVGWIVLMRLISAGTGWRSLARFYRSERPFSGKKYHAQSARLRAGMGYNYILTIGADPQGLYVSVFFLFGAGHPALFIPWADISGVAKRVWKVEVVLLSFERSPKIPFWISRRLADNISQASGAQFFSDESV